VRRTCYFRACGQNSDTAIRFSNPDFLKDNNNLAIKRRFRVSLAVFTLHIIYLQYFYIYFGLLDLMTLNMYHMLRAALG